MFKKLTGMFKPEHAKLPNPPVEESYTKRLFRLLEESDYRSQKFSLRIEPHYKKDGIVAKLPKKFLVELERLYNDGQTHDLTFVLVPISQKASTFISNVKGEHK